VATEPKRTRAAVKEEKSMFVRQGEEAEGESIGLGEVSCCVGRTWEVGGRKKERRRGLRPFADFSSYGKTRLAELASSPNKAVNHCL
jgi:hypothetical protein